MLKVAALHEQEYESLPVAVAAVNGRVHLLGEHTEFLDGKDLSMSVAYPLYVAVSVRKDSAIRFFYSNFGERKRGTLQTLKYKREDRWANNIKAVLTGFVDAGIEIPGMNITITSFIPSASMGIFESMTIAAAGLFRKLFAPSMSDTQLVTIISNANVSFLDRNKSLADTFCALYAQPQSLILSDFSKVAYTTVPFNMNDFVFILTEAKISGVIASNELSIRMNDCQKSFLQLRHSLAHTAVESFLPDDIADVLKVYPELIRRRTLSMVQEIQGVSAAVSALNKGDIATFMRCISHSHELLRDLYEISFPELDWLVKRVQELGTLSAARLTGYGNGGCIYGIMNTAGLEVYKTKLDEYERIFGFHPAVYAVESAGGIQFYSGNEINENIDNK